mmetsp:Transcript_77903/g.167132  ORF Transcript_77903/g.167132 Transcript_77903/m.167132 type:complete len:323 (-) Transcript_77903:74-1042(-)
MVLLRLVQELVGTCFDCGALPEEPGCSSAGSTSVGVTKRVTVQAMSVLGHEVELVVSPTSGLGYHTSVLIAGEEYYFGPFGICCSPRLKSHEAAHPELRREVVGRSQRSGAELLESLSEQFSPGTYDLLRKNCNSFTDCALYFLCGLRLDASLRAMERLGRSLDDRAGLVQSLTWGSYMPNAKASSFDLESVIAEIAAMHGHASDEVIVMEEPASNSGACDSCGDATAVEDVDGVAALSARGAAAETLAPKSARLGGLVLRMTPTPCRAGARSGREPGNAGGGSGAVAGPRACATNLVFGERAMTAGGGQVVLQGPQQWRKV